MSRKILKEILGDHSQPIEGREVKTKYIRYSECILLISNSLSDSDVHKVFLEASNVS
jgi:hypothetical protein